MAYTAEEVDEIIRNLELNTERQIATVGSHVKGVAAERDLLKSAEAARDLLVRAVAGEKEFLDQVFGGSCERIGRLHLPLNKISFSDMHANDQRWVGLRNGVETVEAVLKDLGTFKPWVPPAAKAPEKIAFRGLRRRMSPGRRVNLRLEVEGGEPAEFSVEPALPAALELSPETGCISGVLSAGQEFAEATYVVIARNAAGEARTEITFAVAETPPTELSYKDSVEEILVGDQVHWVPSVDRKAQWSVTPALPAGLGLDEASGVLQGTANEASEETAYEVVAFFAGGRTSVTLRLRVRHGPPAAARYASVPAEGLVLELGEDVRLEPEARSADPEPVTFSVEPALPRGLAIDAESGVISGAAAELAAKSCWTVSVSNSVGSTACELMLSVELSPPRALSVPALEKVYPIDCELSLRPVLEGSADTFSVTPSLPAGLQLDERSGEISGTPTEESPETSYELSARNAAGSVSATLVFAVQLTAPTSLAYPTLSPVYRLGEELELAAVLTGRVEAFSVDPSLPTGIELDTKTGSLSGVPVRDSNEATYVVTASNTAGSCSAELRFAVVAPAPADLAYPGACFSYAVGDAVSIEPTLLAAKGSRLTYSVKPSLPEGLSLNIKTGVISGEPTAAAEEATYRVAVRNAAGESSTELTFEVVEAVASEAIAESISRAFAAQVEATTDIAELCAEPSRAKAFGDWMIWMVHRAHLDDPTLVQFDFSNMHMPPPHVEERIAPKLMKALATNTHIEVLHLPNTNLTKPQGMQLAESLRQNGALRDLNIETNFLDSEAVREIAGAIAANDHCKLEQVRMGHQRQAEFGRPVEEAVGMMMERRSSITKLGFECKDKHWRNIIDRAVLRNNDFARRNRRRSVTGEEDLKAEDKALSRLLLRRPPSQPVAEFFPEENGNKLFRGFVAEQKRIPTSSQMQSYAKNSGSPLKYSMVAPLIKECRARIMDAAINTDVMVADAWMVDQAGRLRGWSTSNENWQLDVMAEDGTRRYNYKSSAEPTLLVSEAWASWLRAGSDGS
eukprot:TRINITY_DN64315_c0_g1_i1.p1 TRINITY_DN64315_c0_g1~~TRINITY_DN64315_c0_g1_i1.p1  ORF type:complete len:1045 (+),score=246.64 TRINITY_DN64315_c0_g1_i1:64-3135(+)